MSDDQINAFADMLTANAEAAADYELAAPTGVARLGLAIVTCIDTRIDPVRMFGVGLGDAKFFRNAGGRVTEDVIRGLAAATATLGVTRIAVVEHTQCKMASVGQDDVVAAVAEAAGVEPAEAASIDYLTIDGQEETLRADVERLRAAPVIPPGTELGGFLFDLETGRLTQVV